MKVKIWLISGSLLLNSLHQQVEKQIYDPLNGQKYLLNYVSYY